VRGLEELFQALNTAGVRYVVVGGLAVNLQGHARLTIDTDLIVDLEPQAARRAVETLLGLGLQPRLPVDPWNFADPQTRSAWIRDKGLRVFSWYDPADPLRVVDLFAESPLPFAPLYQRSDLLSIRETAVRVASLPDLIALKRLAGRPNDLADIDVLEEIARERGEKGPA
jgi:hypothetical protein